MQKNNLYNSRTEKYDEDGGLYMINKRSRDIILYLVEQDKFKKFYTLNELLSIYNVSERTLRYDLDHISNYFLKNSLKPLYYDNDGGIHINNEEERILDLLSDTNYYSFKLSKHERVNLIA